MNAVERIEAAISYLEDLRVWVNGSLTVHEGPEWFELRDESGVQVAPYMSGFNAELFAALHRTIDAQLAILRAGLVWFDDFTTEAPTYSDGRPMGATRMFKVTPGGRATLDLADAILGES